MCELRVGLIYIYILGFSQGPRCMRGHCLMTYVDSIPAHTPKSQPAIAESTEWGGWRSMTSKTTPTSGPAVIPVLVLVLVCGTNEGLTCHRYSLQQYEYTNTFTFTGFLCISAVGTHCALQAITLPPSSGASRRRVTCKPVSRHIRQQMHVHHPPRRLRRLVQL
jgi:hypothetical protein